MRSTNSARPSSGPTGATWRPTWTCPGTCPTPPPPGRRWPASPSWPIQRSTSSSDPSGPMSWTAPAGWRRPISPGWATGPPTRPGAPGTRAAGIAWNWLAAHYRHESRDLHELMDPDNVLEQAAIECRADDTGATTDDALRIDGPTAPTALSPRQPRARVPLQLRVPGADGPRKVMRGRDPARGPAAPGRRTRSRRARGLADDPDPRLPGPGALGRPAPTRRAAPGRAHRAGEHADGRTYHELVALSVVPEGMVPRLALSRSPAECQDVPMDRIRLRPIDKLRQKFYVFVKNPIGPARGA